MKEETLSRLAEKLAQPMYQAFYLMFIMLKACSKYDMMRHFDMRCMMSSIRICRHKCP